MDARTSTNGNKVPRLALRPKEAAEALGISPRKMADMIAMDEIRSVKFGWARLIPMDAIEEVLKART